MNVEVSVRLGGVPFWGEWGVGWVRGGWGLGGGGVTVEHNKFALSDLYVACWSCFYFST